MIRAGSSAVTATVLIWLVGLIQPAQAGKMLYQQCFTARGDTADGFKASLLAGGLFYNWAGSLVNELVLGKFGTCEATKTAPPLFKGSSNAGVNSIAIATFDNGANGRPATVPINQHMLFSSIRNNTAVDEDPMKTTFTKGGSNIGTKFPPASTKALGDPEIIITNSGTSVMTLAAINAQINNSEDPLDPDIFFEPDGTSVTLPTLDSSNDTILPGNTEMFSFDIGNAVNWSFEYTYSINGDTFTDLLATDVPEPNGFGLLAAALGALVLAGRRSRKVAPADRRGPAPAAVDTNQSVSMSSSFTRHPARRFFCARLIRSRKRGSE
jgi:PEP-CTERM motif